MNQLSANEVFLVSKEEKIELLQSKLKRDILSISIVAGNLQLGTPRCRTALLHELLDITQRVVREMSELKALRGSKMFVFSSCKECKLFNQCRSASSSF